MKFVVYRSSAGSGKTFTLVKEYLALALSDVNDPPQRYREILAITFTNKAAAEMKERIVDALKDLSVLQGEQPGILASMLLRELKIDRLTLVSRAKDVLKAILHNYGDFAIGTIDSFTHRIVRAFAYDLHLPTNFEIETDAEQLLRTAVDVLVSKIGTDEKLTEILMRFSESRAEDEQNWQIENDIRNISHHLLHEEGSSFAEKLKSLSLEDFLSIRNSLYSSIHTFENIIKSLAQQAISILDLNGIDDAEIAYGERGISGRLRKLANGQFESLGDSNANITKMIESGNYHAGKVKGELQQRIKEVMPEVLNYWEKICLAEEQEISDYIIRKNILKNIFALSVLNEVEKILTQFKEEDNIIHISAFNRMIADVVFNEPVPFIYERLGEKFKNYLIDEFQDTSVMQWQNLLPLVDNALASGNFTMVVGDGKQAIYRWRGGDVDQFVNIIEGKSTDNDLVKERTNALKRYHHPEVLKENFRSRMEIVDFNNKFFRALSGSLSSTYAEIYTQLEQVYDDRKTGGHVSIKSLPNEENAQLNHTIALVKQLVAEGWQYEQIAILTRKNNEANSIAAELLQNNIPVLATESLLIRNSATVNFIISVLRCIEFPEDELAGANAIVYLAEHQLTNGALLTQFREYHSCDKNLLKFLELKGIRLPSLSLTGKDLYQRCEQIINAFKLRSEDDAFLLFFLDELLHFVNSKGTGKLNFFDWWEERSKKASVVIPEGMNAVKVMTIHKSKGLQFPVVILPYADWEVKKSKKDIWIDYNDPVVPKLRTALVRATKDLLNSKLADVYAEEINRSLLDVINELYVAMTRPVDRLYLFMLDGKKKKDPEIPKDAKECILQSLSKMGLEFEKGEISIGADNVTATPKKLKVDYIHSTTKVAEDWKDRIQLRSHAKAKWDAKVNEELERGKLLHLLLEKIKLKEDVEKVISESLEIGLLSLEQSDSMKRELNRIVGSKEIADCFDGRKNVLIEKNILLPDGTVLRPDRVIGDKEHVLILDYKTGEKEAFHKKQLDAYANTLHSMGYKHIEKIIFYTTTLESVSW